MTRSMEDSINPYAMTRDVALVAGYVNGNWPTFPKLAGLYPYSLGVSIAVTVHADANVLDVEQRDAVPADAPGWVTRQRNNGHDPTVYCEYGSWQEVRTAFQAARVIEPHYWIALYDNIPDLTYGIVSGRRVDLTGIVAKQYGGSSTRNVDFSIVQDYWPEVDDMTPAQEQMLNDCHDMLKVITSGAPQYGVEAVPAAVSYVHRQVNALAEKAGLPPLP